jgi:hypothetical protein
MRRQSFDAFIDKLEQEDAIYQDLFGQCPQLKAYLRVAFQSDGRERWHTYSTLKRQISGVVGWTGSYEPFQTMPHYRAMINALDLALPLPDDRTPLGEELISQEEDEEVA